LNSIDLTITYILTALHYKMSFIASFCVFFLHPDTVNKPRSSLLPQHVTTMTVCLGHWLGWLIVWLTCTVDFISH